jgi:hypothetical protein
MRLPGSAVDVCNAGGLYPNNIVRRMGYFAGSVLRAGASFFNVGALLEKARVLDTARDFRCKFLFAGA